MNLFLYFAFYPAYFASLASLATSLSLLTLSFCFATFFGGFVKQLLVDAGSLYTHFSCFFITLGKMRARFEIFLPLKTLELLTYIPCGGSERGGV